MQHLQTRLFLLTFHICRILLNVFCTSVTPDLSRLGVATIPAAPDGGCGPAYRQLPTAPQQDRQNAVVLVVRHRVMLRLAADGCGVCRAVDHQTAPGGVEPVQMNTAVADHAPAVTTTTTTTTRI